MMANAGDLTETEQQLLMAAALLGFGPTISLLGANTVHILNRVLLWHGQTQEQIDNGWWVDENCDPSHQVVYDTLIRMTEQVRHDRSNRAAERPGTALFEGGGNWGVPGDPDHPPCLPHFNSCRLTSEGERLARLLLEKHSEYREPA